MAGIILPFEQNSSQLAFLNIEKMEEQNGTLSNYNLVYNIFYVLDFL